MSNETPFKVNDPIAFEHMGMKKTGTVIELLDLGKVRVKDNRGLEYRYESSLVKHAAAPAVKPAPAPEPVASAADTTPETEDKNINQPKTTKTMAKKELEVGTADAAQVEKIKALECRKHQRIFLLIDAGCNKEEISKHAGCNFGEISNARKMYRGSEEKTAAAKALLA